LTLYLLKTCFENVFSSKKGTLIKRVGVRTPWTLPLDPPLTIVQLHDPQNMKTAKLWSCRDLPWKIYFFLRLIATSKYKNPFFPYMLNINGIADNCNFRSIDRIGIKFGTLRLFCSNHHWQTKWRLRAAI